MSHGPFYLPIVSLFSGRRRMYSTAGAATKPEPSKRMFLLGEKIQTVSILSFGLIFMNQRGYLRGRHEG